MTKWFKVGKIVNTHGVRGEVRVIATTDFEEERFAIGATLYLEQQNTDERIPLVVASHRKHKNFDLVTFEGYHNINEVESFKGALLKVSEEQLGELDEDEFYYHEIIGSAVVDEKGETIGKVKEILSPGANDVWVVQRKNRGKDLLVPYISDVVKDVNVAEKIITIHLMEGLE
ncbi:ribosome maturation factor RimM [Desertibacillus haloalkaliphilus]|uniref:ribosome maturation factor RimM n=1 Tax=Desertibacillus haloalkaliphilus TaxID=1328930 RepID=UPI001C25B67F|nr:ribosome maturation factor RimM [Desertibacillus haloalkaliphilus]MBU8907036.1 ribosome maturation factor RimM [Desertibacillus haloalkaliphilus]